MANTPNLDLVKPAGTDHALVSVINANSDKIDAGVGTLSEQMTYIKLTSATDFNTLTVGSNKQAKHYRGENIGNNTNIPSGFAGSNIPWGMDVIPIGDSYSKQILHLYGQPYREYERTQKYDNGNVVWQDWYSSYEKFVIERKTSSELTVNANDRGVFTIDVSKNGYTPIGIIQIALANNWMYVGGYSLAGNNAEIIIHNGINRSAGQQTIYITVLYQKN